jgi:uncharacterized protein DUF2799
MRFWLLSAVILSGCAGFDSTACRQADWYDLGFRDAIFGIQPQDLIYVPQCEAHGVKVDVARYAQGWKEGKYEADARVPGSVD